MPQPFVLFDNVCKYYQMGETRIAASDHVSFEIEKGEFCVILGPSGAGKTTVLNMLGGMDTCDEGTILLDGEKVSSFDKKRLTTYRRYDVGFVFQFYNLVQNLTARENVELAAEICRDPLDADTVLDEQKLQLALAKLEGRENAAELRAEVTARVSDLRDKLAAAEHDHIGARRLLRAFPDMKSLKYGETLTATRAAMVRLRELAANAKEKIKKA